ncbi:R-spondin-1-like [Argopecten irradians]|uniref:R-spondin-1-like n=1 Tax=Argopecten irradians TaxID=31199 RepID=UPI00370FFBD1
MACSVLFLAIFVVTLFQAASGFLVGNDTSVITETQAGYGSCPEHCKITPCASQVGCSLCDNGYCLHYQKNGTSTLGVCLSSCPSGYYCQQIRFSICKACKDTNCDTCNFLGKCTNCKSGFSLMTTDGTCHAAATAVSMTTEDPTTTEVMTSAAMTSAVSSSTDMTSASNTDMTTTGAETKTTMPAGPAPVVG